MESKIFSVLAAATLSATSAAHYKDRIIFFSFAKVATLEKYCILKISNDGCLLIEIIEIIHLILSQFL